jgi:hypothetical protein
MKLTIVLDETELKEAVSRHVTSKSLGPVKDICLRCSMDGDFSAEVDMGDTEKRAEALSLFQLGARDVDPKKKEGDQ